MASPKVPFFSLSLFFYSLWGPKVLSHLQSEPFDGLLWSPPFKEVLAPKLIRGIISGSGGGLVWEVIVVGLFGEGIDCGGLSWWKVWGGGETMEPGFTLGVGGKKGLVDRLTEGCVLLVWKWAGLYGRWAGKVYGLGLCGFGFIGVIRIRLVL